MHQLSEITRASPLTSQTHLAPLCRCSRCSYQCAEIVFELSLTLLSELFIPLDILYGNTLACWLVSLFKSLTGYVKTSNAPHCLLGSFEFFDNATEWWPLSCQGQNHCKRLSQDLQQRQSVYMRLNTVYSGNTLFLQVSKFRVKYVVITKWNIRFFFFHNP